MKSLLEEWLSKPYLAIPYSFLILYLCVTPSENLPDHVDDKLAHLLAFGGVGFMYYFVGQQKLLWIGVAILFGVAIEFIQGSLPADFHRGFELMDMVFDGIGVVLGACFAFIFERTYFRK